MSERPTAERIAQIRRAYEGGVPFGNTRDLLAEVDALQAYLAEWKAEVEERAAEGAVWHREKREAEVRQLAAETERDAALAALRALVDKLPKCEAYGYDDKEHKSFSCPAPATRTGSCDPHNSLCCDVHECRHKCPELTYAETLRAAEALLEKNGR